MLEELYDKMYAVEKHHWWFSAKRSIISTLLRRYLLDRRSERPLALADLGCGCGMTLQELPAGLSGTGLDASPKAIEFCRSRGVEARPGRLPDEIPFEPGSFDAVLLADVLEHLDCDGAALEAASRILKPGGVVVVTVPALPSLWSDWDVIHSHKRRYTKRTLTALFEGCGLETEVISYCNTLLLPAALCARVLARKGGGITRAQLDVPPGPINAFLRGVFGLERHLIGRVPLPRGLSLVAVLRKPAETGEVR